MAVANKYDTTMLPATVPGYEALNALKRDILYGNAQKPGVLNREADYQEWISGITTNPYARTIADQARWDELLAWLMAHGYEGRDLYFRSRNELNVLFWDCAPISQEEYGAWERSRANG